MLANAGMKAGSRTWGSAAVFACFAYSLVLMGALWGIESVEEGR